MVYCSSRGQTFPEMTQLPISHLGPYNKIQDSTMQQIKVLQRLLAVRIPQLALSTRFRVFFMSPHTQLPLGQAPLAPPSGDYRWLFSPFLSLHIHFLLKMGCFCQVFQRRLMPAMNREKSKGPRCKSTSNHSLGVSLCHGRLGVPVSTHGL